MFGRGKWKPPDYPRCMDMRRIRAKRLIGCWALAIPLITGCGTQTDVTNASRAARNLAEEVRLQYVDVLIRSTDAEAAEYGMRTLQAKVGPYGGGRWYILRSAINGSQVSVEIAAYANGEGTGPGGNPYGGGWALICVKLTGIAGARTTEEANVILTQISCTPVSPTEKNVPTAPERILITLQPS
jgi:hypothetical protein